MNPIYALERELLIAARRHPTRTRVPRRTLVLAAALGVLVAAIPAAFATGLVSEVFPPADDTPRALGHGYVVASGTTAAGERWSFQLTRGVRFRDGTRPDVCWALLVGDPGDPHNGHGVCTGGGPGPKSGPRAGGATGFTKPISSADPRAMYLADVPRDVALVRITFSRGPALAVRPLQVDQGRARATGTPYPYAFVAVAYDPDDIARNVTYEDANGNDVTPSRGMVFPHGGAPRDPHVRVLQSPAL